MIARTPTTVKSPYASKRLLLIMSEPGRCLDHKRSKRRQMGHRNRSLAPCRRGPTGGQGAAFRDLQRRPNAQPHAHTPLTSPRGALAAA